MDEQTARNKKDNFLILLASFNILLSVFCTVFLGNLNRSSVVERLTEKSPISEKVLGDVNRNYEVPRIVVSRQDGYSSGGVIPLASTDEPAVYLTSSDYNGEAEISVFRSDKEKLLDYLTHDKDNKQLKKTPEITGLNLVATVKQDITSGYDKESKVVLPLEENGIWLLAVKTAGKESFAYVIRSDFAVLVRTGDNKLVFWGQSFKTKRSINFGTIQIYNLLDRPKILNSSSFDSQGIATTRISSEDDIALAEYGGSMALVPLNLRYLGPYAYQSFTAKETKTKYYIFTDRPVYQPGDTVYYKAILRDDDDARYTVARGNAQIIVYKGWDEKENIIYQENTVISDDGSVYGQFVIAKEAGVGNYQLKVSTGNKTATGDYYDWNDNIVNFQVQYYRKPEYFVEVDTNQKEIISHDSLSFTLKGSYFSGQPMAGQEINYKVSASDIYTYQYYSDYGYLSLDDDYYWYSYGATNVEEKTAVLNQDGKASITIPTTLAGQTGKNTVYIISAEIDNGSGNPSFDRKNVLVYSGEFDIFRKDYGYGSQVGKEISIPIILKPHHNGNVADVALKIKVKRDNWMPYFVEDQKYPRYKKETTEYPEINLVTNSKGEASLKYTPESIGSYTFLISASDSRGNLITNNFYTWVTAEDYSFNYDQYQNQLTVKTGKDKYDLGEDAEIIIYSQISDRDVFLAFERSRMDSYEVVSLSGNSAKVTRKISDSDMPNIFANASSFSSFAFNNFSTNILVSTESKKIVVTLTPNKEIYGPKDTVILNIQTNDTAGNPVQTEVAVWAVDKALFQLIDEKPPKIFETFWKTRYDNTPTAHSLQGVVVPTAEMGGGGGGADIRSVFKDAAYWNPAVKTSSSGRATISFKLPDNLTTWMIFAVAANEQTDVGQTSKDIITFKDVVVRPVLPNLLRIGDNARISALVQNFTNTDQEFLVGMEFDSGEVKEPKTGSLTINAKGLQKVSWEIIPQKENPKAKFTFVATPKDNTQVEDKVAVEIPIIEYGFSQQSSLAGYDNTDFPIKLSPGADRQKSTITLSLAPSIVGSLFPAMKYLIYYPYGCVEQVTSTFVPAVIAKENFDLFKDYLGDIDLDTVINASIKKLSNMQNSDGSFSWWNRLKTNSFVTAYVIEYVSRAKALGFDDENILNNAKGYLLSPAVDEVNKKEDTINKAYSLSFYPDKKPTATDFSGVTSNVLPLAIMTNVKTGNVNPQTNGLSMLRALAQSQGESIFWQSGNKIDFGSIDASTALSVRAMLEAKENRDFISKAILFLTRSRKREYWANTFATAQVVDAMTQFALSGQELEPDYTFTVFLDQKQLKSEKVKDGKQKIKDISVPISKIKDAGSNLTITKEGNGQIYSTLVISEWLTDKSALPEENGLTIKRTYLDKDGNVYKKMAVGDEVTVRFSVSGLKVPDNYAILTDQLPAGLVPINESFENEQYDQQNRPYNWDASVDITQNGANLYLYDINAGENIYTYRARAVSAGTFLVPPSTVSLMYSPEVWGRSKAETVMIADTKEVVLKPVPQQAVFKENNKKSMKSSIIIAGITIGLGILIIVVRAIRKKFKTNFPPPSSELKQ